MTIQFAERTAWRAVYVYTAKRRFALGIDPTFGPGPQWFLGWGQKTWHFRLPHLRWRYKAGRIYNAAYQLQQRILHGLDGRYGWGTK